MPKEYIDRINREKLKTMSVTLNLSPEILALKFIVHYYPKKKRTTGVYKEAIALIPQYREEAKLIKLLRGQK